MHDLAPDSVRPLERSERFRFRCHPGVGCFTDCCRELELELSPYDVLRLRRALGLSGAEFLDRYAVIEQEAGEPLPRVYLGMVDDGRGSCPFVSEQGCRVYADRPGACRTYPVGRGAMRRPDGTVEERFVLLTEPHCHGFGEDAEQDVDGWLAHEELEVYNRMNDATMAVSYHERLRQGLRLSASQVEEYLTAFYRLEEFRELAMAADFDSPVALTEAGRRALAEDDEALLRFAVRWLRHRLFGE